MSTEPDEDSRAEPLPVTTNPGDTRVFVYNAKGGLVNGALDALHKIVSPRTYPCSLCALTHGPLRMHGRWRSFVDELDGTTVFLHADELEGHYGPPNVPLPAVFRARDGVLELRIDAATLDGCASLEDLMELVRTRT